MLLQAKQNLRTNSALCFKFNIFITFWNGFWKFLSESIFTFINVGCWSNNSWKYTAVWRMPLHPKVCRSQSLPYYKTDLQQTCNEDNVNDCEMCVCGGGEGARVQRYGPLITSVTDWGLVTLKPSISRQMSGFTGLLRSGHWCPTDMPCCRIHLQVFVVRWKITILFPSCSAYFFTIVSCVVNCVIQNY